MEVRKLAIFCWHENMWIKTCCSERSIPSNLPTCQKPLMHLIASIPVSLLTRKHEELCHVLSTSHPAVIWWKKVICNPWKCMDFKAFVVHYSQICSLRWFLYTVNVKNNVKFRNMVRPRKGPAWALGICLTTKLDEDQTAKKNIWHGLMGYHLEG